MKPQNHRNLYSESDLANGDNYSRLENTLHLFADLNAKSQRSLKIRLRQYISHGMLVGRIYNASPTGAKRGQRYEVFLPDVLRFKRDIFKQP